MKTQKLTLDGYERIKLGIDAHAQFYYVCRQVEGSTPQAVQKMTLEALLRFVAKQLEQARGKHSFCASGTGQLDMRS